MRERAGVGKATIYRRWSSKQELVRDAIAYMHDDIEAPDTGSLLGDYEGLAGAVRAAAQREGAATFVPRLLGEAVGDPELHAIFYANLSSRGATRCGWCSSARSRAARSAPTSTSSS